MRTCEAVGCHHEAKFVPKLNVPILAIGNVEADPVAGILGLNLCEEHANAIQLSHFPNIRDVASAILGPDSVGADWPNAYFTKVAMDSNEYELYINPPKIEAPKHTHIPGMATPHAPMPKPLPRSAFN